MRPGLLTSLFSSVEAIPRVGPKLGKLLAKFCGPFVSDVLWHLPTGVIHRPLIQKVSDICFGEYGTIGFLVQEHLIPPTRRQPYRIIGETAFGMAELVFFNYRKKYLEESYPTGQTLYVSGRLERQGLGIKILHPDYTASQPNLIPEYEVIYPQSRGVNSKIIRRVVSNTLSQLPDLPEWLDLAFMTQHQLPSWKQAVQIVHHPRKESDFSPSLPARYRLAYDEILANQLALLLVRRKMTLSRSGLVIQSDGRLTQPLLKQLPFQLTGAQQRVFQEIKKDLSAQHQMIRLLQGDVGSGKTIVALLAALSVVESGCQAAIMAPTDILARQHFQKLADLCAPLGVAVGVLTAREKGKVRQEVLSNLKNGNIKILVGTHALLTDTVCFRNLGLVVIDEQHKFGVHQRLDLLQKQQGVNLLVMTATPIPRSLALTAYGDMDISRLDEKPIGRQPIETRVMSVEKVSELSHRLFAQIQTTTRRTQAYWICPLVEDSEKSDLMAVKRRFLELQQIFHERVGLVHGKMTGAEKDAVMQQFARGDLDVLVATTVIEVGIDVKTASIMIIEQAERFGLAGLHQLRGRVGRGSDKSLCLLLHGPHLSDTAQKRLAIMRETDDGFVLAEEDLKLRGAGEILGTRQSGALDFKLVDMSLQSDLLWIATKDAQTILTLDPLLKSPRGQALRLLLSLFQKDAEIETLKSG